MRYLATFEGPYGTLCVLEDTVHRAHVLMHGETMHGWQFRDDDRLDEPTAYYTASSPAAALFASVPEGGSIAVVGLGVGACAALAPSGTRVTFFEIDPQVVSIAHDPRWFSFLSRSRARCNVVLGDALSTFAGRFHLVLVDAFFGDAAVQEFFAPEVVARFAAGLEAGGVLAWHVTSTRQGHDHLPMLAAASESLVCTYQSARSPALARDPTLEIDEGFDLSAPVDTRWAALTHREVDAPDGWQRFQARSAT
jgi:hypothetical protein